MKTLAAGIISLALAAPVAAKQQVNPLALPTIPVLGLQQAQQAQQATIQLAARTFTHRRRVSRLGNSSRRRFTGISSSRFVGNGSRNRTANRHYNASRRGSLRRRISRHRRHI